MPRAFRSIGPTCKSTRNSSSSARGMAVTIELRQALSAACPRGWQNTSRKRYESDRRGTSISIAAKRRDVVSEPGARAASVDPPMLCEISSRKCHARISDPNTSAYSAEPIGITTQAVVRGAIARVRNLARRGMQKTCGPR
jgi:hypothetical protein